MSSEFCVRPAADVWALWISLQISKCQHPQLHHQLARRNGVQRPHSQTQVGTPHCHQDSSFSSWLRWSTILPPSCVIWCSMKPVSSFAYRPDLIDFDKLKKSNVHYNLQNAFNLAEQHLGLTKLLDPEGEILFLPIISRADVWWAAYYNILLGKTAR